MKTFPYPKTPYEIPPEAMPLWSPYHKTVDYKCPNQCWTAHHKDWCDEWRVNRNCPTPMPEGHMEFEQPQTYGMVPFGCTDDAMIRAALERSVRCTLDGWDRDVPEDKLNKIVALTVDMKMRGKETGAAPFFACIGATL